MFLPVAALALFTTSAFVWFAVGSSILLVLAYLCVGHGNHWIAYYVEITPVLAILTAIGWWRLTSLISNRRLAWPLRSVPSESAGAVLGLIVSGILLFPYITRAVPYIAGKELDRRAYQSDFRTLLGMTPGEHIMVFIRYAPSHSAHMSLVKNEPDLAQARVWTVYDRGVDNIRLMRLDPRRTPYLFDDEHRVMVPLDSMGVPHYDHIIREPGERY
jgi:hypothetical protein